MSKLQREVGDIIYTHFSHLTIRENYRPEWLQTGNGGRLELDFFIEELRVAIEVQGRQHYRFIPYFHGDYEGFKDRLSLDRLKRKVCDKMGIELYEVASADDMRLLLYEIDDGYEPPIHPNAIIEISIPKSPEKAKKQNKKKYQYVGAKLYPRTINKHLERILRIINKSESELTDRDIRRLDISSRAIDQYQEAVASIEFRDLERDLLMTAQVIIDNYSK